MKHSRLFLAALVLTGCYGSLNLTRSDADIVLSQQLLDAPNPAAPGAFTVKRLYYGNGTDKRRAEFRDSVAIKTKTVDMSKFVSMEPNVAKDRKKYWGFDSKAFPINGRVWYPEGAGPFPLVLIVHGNHNMKDFSDPGYGYLGELLASRGFILVSVDENFINGGLRGENDGRGVAAARAPESVEGLQRLDQEIRSTTKSTSSNIALMGHSRGGEAVRSRGGLQPADALPRRRDGEVQLRLSDQGASSPSRRLMGSTSPPASRRRVENVNYLVFHGSHDGDVSRLPRTAAVPTHASSPTASRWFKSAVYVYRANHGQWNTVWGNKDNGPRSGRLLDLRGLISPEEQRQFGKVYIGAFLEATLNGEERYLPMFRDHRVAGGFEVRLAVGELDALVLPQAIEDRHVAVVRAVEDQVVHVLDRRRLAPTAVLPVHRRDRDDAT